MNKNMKNRLFGTTIRFSSNNILNISVPYHVTIVPKKKNSVTFIKVGWLIFKSIIYIFIYHNYYTLTFMYTDV